jgi:hypothetical protein
MQRVISAAVAAVALFSVTGCSTGTGSSISPGNAAYWLVRVEGGNGNIYAYPRGYGPGRTEHAAYVGSTTADAQANARAKAPSLGITHLNTTIVQ